jgi:excisionase family DNA binding protein
MSELQLLTTAEAAKRLRVSRKTLEGWRWRGGGPRFVKLGDAVRYQVADLEAFVAAGARTSTSEEPRAAAAGGA